MSLSQIELCQLIWRKAARSMNAGDCVEVAPAKGKIFVRDSKNPNGSQRWSTMLTHGATFVTEARANSLRKR